MGLYTYQDALQHAMDYLGGSGDRDRRDAIRAIQSAYRELAGAHQWSYYYTQMRLDTVAPYDTGTIAYTHSSRSVTLTSGTWPTWARYGTIIIDSHQYQVASRSSDSVIVLSASSNPGANVASGTTYTIFRSTYPLPANFIAMDDPSVVSDSPLCYVRPGDWLQPQSILQQPGRPSVYTILSDENYLNTMAIAFSPPPDAIYHYDAIYLRRPRPLRLVEYSTGTATVSASSATVTGASTAWDSTKHEGCVIRLGADGTNAPTGEDGLYPAEVERIVATVGSTTSITADADFDSALSAVKYNISDVVDVENGAMLSAFLRKVELELARVRRMNTVANAEAIYQAALLLAMESDSRSFAPRGAGYGGRYGVPTIGEDVE